MVNRVSSQGLQWFQDARFGMFIHWGLYSLLGRGEWVMHNEQIPVIDYEKLIREFNPVNFNADDWVSIAADAGQKYMVFTSRHHDGFSMFDTMLSDYKVTNTPFKRDPIYELAQVCARRGDVKLGFYVSLLDWYHPAYRFREQSGLAWSDYIGFLHGQVRELCTQFGDIACFWFDGDWPRHAIDERNAYFTAGGSFEYEQLYDMIHSLQPDTVVLNNRHAAPFPGEDVQGFEQDLPGQNSAGFNTTDVYRLPLEVCLTINDNWGFHGADENHKSTRYLVHLLARAASLGANLLLNVGPTPLGVIHPVHIQRLYEIGEWLKLNGKAIYGTRAGIITPSADIVSTRRRDIHYVHLLEYISDSVRLKGLPPTVTRASLERDGEPIKLIQNQDNIRLTIPMEYRDAIDTVVEVR